MSAIVTFVRSHRVGSNQGYVVHAAWWRAFCGRVRIDGAPFGASLGWVLSPGEYPAQRSLVGLVSGRRWRVAALPSWTWTLAVVHICKASV